MKILVCIKQVPESNKVEVDPVTGVLKRDGAASKMNPYDLYALETAFRIREEVGGSVHVISMGPPQAQQVIREAFAMGADGGTLLSDRKFGGADVLATSYTLAQGIKSCGDFDLILCGKQTTDGDTAQVGPETAEFLHMPHAANVRTVEAAESGRVRYVAALDNKVVTATVATPCLLCTDAEINTPRLPSYRKKCAAEKEATRIRVISVDDFTDRDAEHYGLAGSATKVERIFPPEKNADRQTIDGDDAAVCDAVFLVLKNGKYV